MDTQYSYTAFISYSHRDKNFAQRLREKIINFKISPYVSFKAEPETPKIFIDYENLDAGSLPGNIEAALNNSEFLIVICSKNSKDSDWVNNEVRLFAKNHDVNNIIPVLYSKCGIMNSHLLLGEELRKIETVSEHLQLSGNKIIAEKTSKDCLQLVAMLHKCKFEDLNEWNEAKAETKYYKDYVDVDGMYRGIFELTKEQIKHRSGHYTFYKDKEGKVIRISYENSLGYPIEVESHYAEYRTRPSIMEFTYNVKGKLESIINKNHLGTVLNIQKFRKNGFVKYYEDNGEDESFFNIDTLCLSNQNHLNGEMTKISSFKIERDENGFLKRLLFYADDRTKCKATTAEALHGFLFLTDELGRINQKFFLGIDENFIKIHGSSGIIYTYDEEGNLSSLGYAKEDFFETDKKSLSDIYVEIFPSIYTQSYDYDCFGNMICKGYKGEDEDFVNGPEGFAVQVYQYNEKGFLVCYFFSDKDGKRIVSHNKEKYSVCRQKYNEFGDVVEIAFFDDKGKPVKNYNLNCHLTKSAYDNKRREVRFSYYDENGKCALVKNERLPHKEFSTMSFQYDEDSNKEICVTAISDNGDVVDEIEYVYEGNLLVGIKYNTSPLDGKSNCYEVHEYDDYGNRICVDEYGILLKDDGKPQYIKLRTTAYKFDEACRCTEIELSYVKDNKEKLERTTIVYDELGRETEVFIKNEEGGYMLGKDNVYRTVQEYQGSHLSIRQEFGEDIADVPNLAKRITKFNDKNEPIDIKYYDKNDKLLY